METKFFNSRVDEYLQSLEKPTYAKVLKQIKLLREYGRDIGMPYSKQIAHNLYELRIRGIQEVRIFYCFQDNFAVLLHAFVKKSQKTPLHEIETALRRISSLT